MAGKRIERIADLVPDDRNANRGTERGGAMIERSDTQCAKCTKCRPVSSDHQFEDDPSI